MWKEKDGMRGKQIRGNSRKKDLRNNIREMHQELNKRQMGEKIEKVRHWQKGWLEKVENIDFFDY